MKTPAIVTCGGIAFMAVNTPTVGVVVFPLSRLMACMQTESTGPAVQLDGSDDVMRVTHTPEEIFQLLLERS
jgi:hypothetical protein